MKASEGENPFWGHLFFSPHQASYTADGVRRLLKHGGSKRKEVTKKMIEGMGATLEAYYFAFGETDVYVIADLPGHISSLAGSLVASATGALGVKTTVLITPEEVDQAVRKPVDWVPPGQ